MIDSHCHLNATYTADTVKPVLERFASQGGEMIVDVSTNIQELNVSQQLMKLYPKQIYANAGIHPESPNGEKVSFEELLHEVELIKNNFPELMNVVGIGETGIDYSHKSQFPDIFGKVIEQQRELFVAHIQLAKKLSLPLVIHARGESVTDYTAYLDILSILKEENFGGGVYFHSYGGDYEIAAKIIDLGYVLGVNGIVTYSGAKAIAETVEKIPLESLLLETDSPFLIPSNMIRAELGNPKINEPLGIFSTAKRIATLKKSQQIEVLTITKQTALKFFARML